MHVSLLNFFQNVSALLVILSIRTHVVNFFGEWTTSVETFLEVG